MMPIMNTRTIKSRNKWYLSKRILQRSFAAAAVKELPWCAPKDSPNRTQRSVQKNHPSEQPIASLGIVAAMSRNRVIGVNGGLPWNLPEDRRAFVQLTSGKILIVGRRTYEERPSRSHISHAAHCIVVSKTMSSDNVTDNTFVAHSFPQALHIAKGLAEQLVVDGIPCWVAGGELLYHEALLHPSVDEFHLTIIDIEIPEDAQGSIARFPAKYRWENKFRLKTKNEQTSQTSGLHFTTYIFQRLKGLR